MDGLIGDGLILFEHGLQDTADMLIKTFATVRGLNSNTILSICLLKPGKIFKRHEVLDYVLDRIRDPELETISAFEYYGIADNNPDLTKATPSVYAYHI